MLIARETKGYLPFGAALRRRSSFSSCSRAFFRVASPDTSFSCERVSCLDFAEPLCISPILLFPLFGSVQGAEDLQPMQVVSFALLAFQNGFFWQVVLQGGQPKPWSCPAPAHPKLPLCLPKPLSAPNCAESDSALTSVAFQLVVLVGCQVEVFARSQLPVRIKHG